MSIVVTKHHNETIYDILYKEPPRRPKSPMYVSEKEIELKRQHSSKPKTHATMGYAEVPLKKVDEFLKKGEGIHVSSKTQKKACLMDHKRPNLPKQNAAYIKHKANKEEQNWKLLNKKYVKDIPVSSTKQPATIVDSSDGHTSGVYKFKWVYGNSFGNVPKYLVKRCNMIKAEEEKYRRKLETDEPLCKPISQEERRSLLEGLKENWSRLQKEFLLLPVLIDTIPKVIRKSKLEAQLKQLEDDIRMIEENPYIFVYH